MLLFLSFRCACGVGELASDERHCHQPSAFLAYATGKDIRFLHLTGMLNQPPYQAIQTTSHTVGLDYDFEEKLIFFSVLSKFIMKVHFNGTGLKAMSINRKFDLPSK